MGGTDTLGSYQRSTMTSAELDETNPSLTEMLGYKPLEVNQNAKQVTLSVNSFQLLAQNSQNLAPFKIATAGRIDERNHRFTVEIAKKPLFSCETHGQMLAFGSPGAVRMS
ncbi:MAG: hypothetical protein J2P13_09985 [Acidobacteria bacterium]|nr:hypothetical protein [Acidobacteriota bacterium]